jgi:superfamily II DNA or RNA helicase/DNA-binding XRE family transcriptional regulator
VLYAMIMKERVSQPDSNGIGVRPGPDYSERVKRFRAIHGLTQQALALQLGVSFATVNRWENGQTRPSQLSWKRLRELEMTIAEEETPYSKKKEKPSTILDFTAQPEIVKVLAEGERLSFGHLVNPAFATEISSIDPLPHQRIAVYEHMLKQARLRYLLADDAGAGKTIMSGLYIREMLARRLLRRILIVPPAGLVGNWRRELLTLFNLPFRIVSGNDARNDNPFVGDNSNHIIISVDTLASPRVFARLSEPEVGPYDLVIFDEAHKLSADRGADLRVRKIDRYCLAEALAGIQTHDKRWRLGWSAHHLLLLTATPHMGKDYPYYALWHLLEPEMLATPEAFNDYPTDQRSMHFIRRTKEEMVYLDGRPMYPKRISDTLGYDLSRGDLPAAPGTAQAGVSEHALYDETTDYLRFVYNRAKLLNREAARLAMSIFQRRLASSTYALMRSFERRIDKLDKLIADVQEGKLTTEQLITLQQRIHEEDDIFDAKTADDETPDLPAAPGTAQAEEGREENEIAEEKLLQGVVAASLADLIAEKGQVRQLLDLARKVYDAGHESKFEKLRDVLTDTKFAAEKFIVFTEHRDTLEFLVKRLGGMGYTGQIAQIHGGMHYTQREEEVERFRKPLSHEGARFLICTDAAGEGINLQFCWIMINYDVPWNPARLEQRMGRIHRYGQKHDPVVILNLVAPSTREGRVLKVLLEKLEKIREELQSDKVFDCIGRIFQGVSIKQYMELAVTGDSGDVARELDGRLTKEQVEALGAREKSLYGSGGDIAKELPRLRANLEQEVYFRLLPGYVRQYVQQAAPLVDLEVEGDMDGVFSLRPARVGAMDPLLPMLELYPEKARDSLSVSRPAEPKDIIWLHPGEPVFERFRTLVSERLSNEGRRGAVFVDPITERPYLFHMALLSVVRKADPEIPELAKEEVLDCRLVGVKQYEGAEIALCPVEHLLLLKGGRGLPASAQRMAVGANEQKELASAYLAERVAREMALERKARLLKSMPERVTFIQRGFDYQEAELAAARAKHSEKARSGLPAPQSRQAGNRKALEALEEVKRLQRQVAGRRDSALGVLRREPELIGPGTITFMAHALVVPSSDPADLEQHEVNVELVAMRIAQAFEEAAGARVLDVHTPELARAVGLPDNPGFDLLCIRPSEKRAIEVKGRAGIGEIEVSANEWAKACNMRQAYWLYTVYECATPSPRLVRVQDPFGSLLARSKGSFLISPREVVQAAAESST